MGAKNILHIDDDEDDLDFFSVTIKNFNSGITCISLNCAKEALSKLISGELTPDIIFLDLNMPGMNGFKFLEEFQKLPIRSIPIVVLSTSSQKETKAAVLKSGGKYYLTKPNSTKDLLRLLNPFFE
jgi:CheY-like chemotaxis protein